MLITYSFKIKMNSSVSCVSYSDDIYRLKPFWLDVRTSKCSLRAETRVEDRSNFSGDG